MTTDYDALFIGGRWITPHGANRIQVVGSSTQESLGSVPLSDETDVDVAVAAARAAYEEPNGWAHWEPARRADAMDSLISQLQARAEDMARLVSAQNGMPISLSRELEAGFPLAVLGYYAQHARDLAVEVTQPGLVGGTSVVRREPIGVVAAIVPWNFPQTLASFKHAPALAAGCTLVLKPSPETVLDAMLFAAAVAASDLPAGVINVVTGGPEVGAYLVQHPGVDKIAFTGSTAAGRQIGEACARLIRPCTLELGGKSAAIVLDDADLDLGHIGENLFAATLLNNGQTCFLSTRILAPASRYDEVVDTVVALAESAVVGDALDERTQVGPMVSRRHRERVESYIAKGCSDGARLVTGGRRPASLDQGWFVEPTVFAEVDNASTIAQEEIFGPVLTITRYDSVEEAIRLANDSDYGLGGSVWTDDPDRGLDVARRIRTGTIGVNRYLPDPGAPFGGVKASGIGRELGLDGLRAYQSTKTIYAP